MVWLSFLRRWLLQHAAQGRDVGEQTTDEICIAFLHYTLDREHLAVRDQSAGKMAQK